MLPPLRIAPLLLPMLAALLAAVAPAAALPAQFTIFPGEDGNRVTFVSKAPMETVEGKTDQVSGTVNADLDALDAGCQVEVRVDLASLDTGLGKRNQHMRENHLETDSYPEAVFTADSLLTMSATALAPGASVAMELAGDFALHGVTRRIEVPVSVARSADGNSLTVEAKFAVKLADYSISRPKFLFLKLDEVQNISVALTARHGTHED